jgi:hypothetical protein
MRLPRILYNFKLIVHVRRVLLISSVSSLLHIRRHRRIVLLDAALIIAAESVASEVRVR